MDGITIVIHGYRVIERKSAEYVKKGETHNPLRHGLTESFKPGLNSREHLHLLVPISYLVVCVLVSSQKMTILRSRALDQTDN